MTLISDAWIRLGGVEFPVSRPHAFGLVIDGPASGASGDYLHDLLLKAEHRTEFLDLIDKEGLVVCKNLQTEADSYRKVRGKSSFGKLSQAEYYHHDGCSCPVKPRVVEIRLPYQKVARQVATAVAPFPAVIQAMLNALPQRLTSDAEVQQFRERFLVDVDQVPHAQTWDRIQGKVTRLVRHEMDAESCRSYFREVDQLANAYVLPWEMGESRLMVNSVQDLTKTMQHRRAYQKPRQSDEVTSNGSLVKRWTAEEA